MATVHLSPIGNAAQFFDANAKPLTAGQLFTYAAGTSTPQATYTDAGGTIQNANPIVLAADGRVPQEVWLVDGLSYKFVLQDSIGNTIGSYDNMYGLAKTTAQENFNVKDFGAIGDGVSDDSPAVQSALNAVPSTGGSLYFPDGKYRLHGLVPKPNTTVQCSAGAILLADLNSGALFLLQNPALQTTVLSLVVSNGFGQVVVSTAGMNAGDYMILSAGNTFGPGPLEFNQIDIVGSGTTLVSRNPAQIDYSSLGLPGAAPKVFGLGPNPIRNFRLTGGTVTAFSAASGGPNFVFAMQNVEGVTIDNVRFDGGAASTATGLGAGILTGTAIGTLIMDKCQVRGERTFNNYIGIECSAVANSIIRDNIFNIANPFTGTFTSCPGNSILLQNGSWRNRIDSNLLYPYAIAGEAMIDLAFYCFMNMICNNQLYGNDPQVQIGTNIIGIDTTRGANAPNMCGNVIVGNIINDVLSGIRDGQVASAIRGNVLSNFHLNASSVGIASNTDEALHPWFGNVFVNFQTPIAETATPFGSIKLFGVAFANVGTPGNGTGVYVNDGTSGSSPLTGGGTGCWAIRQNGAWKGL